MEKGRSSAFDPFEYNGNYSDLAQAKLEDVIKSASPPLIAGVIRKVLENLVITERLAQAKGIEIEEKDKRQLLHKEYPDIQAEVDRAVGEFVASIVSREGG